MRFLFVFSAIVLVAPTARATDNFHLSEVTAADRRIWEETVGEHLKAPLWRLRDNYDASHTLMVPLHAAFFWKENAWQEQFAEMTRRFAQADPAEIDSPQLNRLQWAYLMSRFCVLAQKFGRADLVPPGLVEWTEGEARKQWIEGRIRVNVLWNLAHPNQLPHWTIAIADNQWFCFTVAADMKVWRTRLGQPVPPEIEEAVQVALRTLREQSRSLPDGGWIYQPGIMADHAEYAFAGRTAKVPGMEPLPRPGTGQDTSHAHRWALWLHSMAEAFPAGTKERVFLEDLQDRLEHQFYTQVLVQPAPEFPAPRTLNFMDGWNGVYRWNYTETNNGYGPFELSGTLALGWWTFLGSERMRKSYADLAAAFPLPASVLNVYLGLPSIRTRHPLVAWPAYFENGYAQFVSSLAAKLPAPDSAPAGDGTFRLRVAYPNDRGMQFVFPLKQAAIHALEQSVDLVGWKGLGDIVGAEGVKDGFAAAPATGRAFYRLRLK